MPSGSVTPLLKMAFSLNFAASASINTKSERDSRSLIICALSTIIRVFAESRPPVVIHATVARSLARARSSLAASLDPRPDGSLSRAAAAATAIISSQPMSQKPLQLQRLLLGQHVSRRFDTGKSIPGGPDRSSGPAREPVSPPVAPAQSRWPRFVNDDGGTGSSP